LALCGIGTKRKYGSGLILTTLPKGVSNERRR
jgi:hypothetical protein